MLSVHPTVSFFNTKWQGPRAPETIPTAPRPHRPSPTDMQRPKPFARIACYVCPIACLYLGNTQSLPFWMTQMGVEIDEFGELALEQAIDEGKQTLMTHIFSLIFIRAWLRFERIAENIPTWNGDSGGDKSHGLAPGSLTKIHPTKNQLQVMAFCRQV